MKIAMIEWRDAYQQRGDAERTDETKDYLDMVSVGCYIDESDESIRIGLDYCPEQDSFREKAVIPKMYVTRTLMMDIEILSPKPGKRRKRGP